MINFLERNDNLLILEYEPDHDWVSDKFEKGESISLKETFRFSKDDLYISDSNKSSKIQLPIEFVLARLKGEYFKIDGRILSINMSLFIHKGISISIKFFTAVKNISIFKKINQVVSEDIYIGGENPNALPKK